MELVGNTFFWTFFFMIGFVASLEIVEDLGPELMMRWFHRKVSAAVMIAVYVIAIILFVRMLRLLGTTYSWTANAIRNGTLIYVSKRLKDKKKSSAGCWWRYLSAFGHFGIGISRRSSLYRDLVDFDPVEQSSRLDQGQLVSACTGVDFSQLDLLAV